MVGFERMMGWYRGRIGKNDVIGLVRIMGWYGCTEGLERTMGWYRGRIGELL